jgi:hypothetical protein
MNNGASCAPAARRIPGWTSALFSHQNHVFAGAAFGVFVSYDNCQSWQDASTDLPTFQFAMGSPYKPPIINGFIAHGSMLFAYSYYDYGIFYSSDGGFDWAEGNNGQITNITSIAADSTYIYAAMYDPMAIL